MGKDIKNINFINFIPTILIFMLKILILCLLGIIVISYIISFKKLKKGFFVKSYKKLKSNSSSKIINYDEKDKDKYNDESSTAMG